jgi:hypothetical protein
VDNRIERIVLETARHQIVGDLTLPKEGYRSRLSDFLNRGDVAFISLVNAEITEREAATDGIVTRPFIAVARDHVQIAYPLKDA